MTSPSSGSNVAAQVGLRHLAPSVEGPKSGDSVESLLVSVLKGFLALDFLLNRRDPGLWSVAPRVSLNPLDVGTYLLVTELAARCRNRLFLSLRRSDDGDGPSEIDFSLVSWSLLTCCEQLAETVILNRWHDWLSGQLLQCFDFEFQGCNLALEFQILIL